MEGNKELEMLEDKPKKKSKAWLSGSLVLILGVIIGLGIMFRGQLVPFFKGILGQKEEENTGKSLGISEEKKSYQFKWKLWEDNAGFSFEYPDNLKVEVHPEDESNYSFLTLTSPEYEGKIEIICTDSQYPDIKEWLKKDSLAKMGSGMETKVASVSAQKVALGEGRELTALVDADKVIYTFDKVPLQEASFWSEVYSHLLSSFKLIPLEGESEADFTQWLGDFDTGNADVVEDVEVIE